VAPVSYRFVQYSPLLVSMRGVSGSRVVDRLLGEYQGHGPGRLIVQVAGREIGH
jgi:hypothetical protein